MLISPSPFLRQALLADAVTCFGFGLLLTAAAQPLGSLLALPVGLLRIAGIASLPVAALVGFLSLRPTLPRKVIWLVIGINLLWAAESGLLLASGLVAPNAAGLAFVLAQAAAVLLYAGLQMRGLKQSGGVAA